MRDRRSGWRRTALAGFLAAAAGLGTPLAQAEEAELQPDEPGAGQVGAAAPEADVVDGAQPAQRLPWQHGPAHVELGHQLELELQSGYMYLPREAATQVLEQMGNFHNEDVLGLATSADANADWFVVFSYEAEGHVQDDEAIDADELLASMREGSEALNAERQERGFQPLTLEGWAEPPHYDRGNHQLVWGLVVSDPTGKSVNYDTRLLGRHGYASLNLVTDPNALAAYKPEATALLQSTHFSPGARYEDFDSSKDETASYGLAGLIAAGAGVGASKLIKIGLLAKFWKVLLVGLAAGKKVIVLAVFAAGAAVKKFLSGRNGGGEAAS